MDANESQDVHDHVEDPHNYKTSQLAFLDELHGSEPQGRGTLGKQADELEESSAQYSQRLHRFRSAAWTTARGASSTVPMAVVLEALGLAPLYEAYTDAIKYDVPYQPLVLPGLEDLSEQRLFFFAWCCSLCSGERMPKGRALASLRCNLAVANQAPFIKAFARDPGLPMNPAVKCPLW
ncbi:hypothetical protein HPB50_008830 [Hyalomma asiaticum]|uniref:Uncharacterized protein n=1 Tax=Hyalomma asiaticum TaxID=266040 RepID=A0ACB7TKY5_HYAAI|nr:hypothetical protein HPB50_008830 [Hyalomma asiaticum]